jgi:hypothetical protein
VNGGTAVSSTLTLQSTSGAGSSDAIIFKTASQSERMRILTTGEVGIGTASPGGKLDVVGGRSFFAAASEPYGVGARYISTGGAVYFGATNGTATPDVQISAAGGGALMTLMNNGNVGIGTTSPGTKLDVLASGTANTPADPLGVAASFMGTSALNGQSTNSIVSISSNDALAANRGGLLTFGGIYSGTSQAIWASIAGFKENATSGAYGGYLAFYTRANGANNTERMRIDPSGNVGIGTASNAGNTLRYLDVQNTDTGSSAGAIIRLITSNSAGTGSNTVDLVRYKTGIFLINNNDSSGIIAINNAGSERMRIDSTGNVLIGYTTSNGLYLLQVNSQIFATNATIATSDGRYKENISSIKSGLDVVGKLNPVSFTWKQHEIHNFDSGTQVGFIAQDVQAALTDEPYLESVVKRNEVELKDGTKEEFYGLSDAKLIPILVKAIQELKAEIDILKARN